MVNEEVAQIFERMARLLAFKGKDRFRISAYERAAVSIRDLEQDLASVAEQRSGMVCFRRAGAGSRRAR